jgi:hypothetical protein
LRDKVSGRFGWGSLLDDDAGGEDEFDHLHVGFLPDIEQLVEELEAGVEEDDREDQAAKDGGHRQSLLHPEGVPRHEELHNSQELPEEGQEQGPEGNEGAD